MIKGKEKIEEMVIDFLFSFLLNVKKDKIFLHSDLQKDFNLYGDEAIEFLLEFSKVFNTKVTDFQASLFFKGEGLIFSPEKDYAPLYVSDLVNAVKLGELHHKNCAFYARGSDMGNVLN